MYAWTFNPEKLYKSVCYEYNPLKLNRLNLFSYLKKAYHKRATLWVSMIYRKLYEIMEILAYDPDAEPRKEKK